MPPAAVTVIVPLFPPKQLTFTCVVPKLTAAAGCVIVTVAWPLLRVALRGEQARRRLLIQLASSPILAAGLYWFLSRAWT